MKTFDHVLSTDVSDIVSIDGWKVLKLVRCPKYARMCKRDYTNIDEKCRGWRLFHAGRDDGQCPCKSVTRDHVDWLDSIIFRDIERRSR